MAPEPRESHVDLGGRSVRLLECGEGPAVVLLHGGAAGGGPLPASAELWGDFAIRLAVDHRVLALDLAGSGRSVATDAEQLTPDGMARTIAEAVAALGVQEIHLVAHDECGLPALALARNAPAGVAVRSCTLLAPAALAPSGDQSLNLALLHRPAPFWTRRSLLWTLRRISPAVACDPAFVERLEENAEGEAHASAIALREAAARALDRAAARARTELYAYCRDRGYRLPLAVVWGALDPLSSLERAMLLYSLLSGGSGLASFHALGSCGHLPHRDSPGACADLVRSQVALSQRAKTAPAIGGGRR